MTAGRTYAEKEAAHELGLSLNQIARLRVMGAIGHDRVGNGRGFVRYYDTHLQAYRERHG